MISGMIQREIKVFGLSFNKNLDEQNNLCIIRRSFAVERDRKETKIKEFENKY